MARWVRWNNPTIKPPFGAQIDWSNPITQGLVGIYLFNEYGSIKVYNIVNFEDDGTYNSGILDVSNLRWVIRNFGEGIYFDNTQNVNTSPVGILSPDPGFWHDETTELTIFLICTLELDAGAPIALLDIGGATHGLALFYRTSPDTICYCVSQSGKQTEIASTSTFVPNINKPIFITSVFNKGNGALYLNSNKEAATTYPESTIQHHVDDPGIGAFNGTNAISSTSADEWGGTLFTLGFWNRALTDQEVECLHQEPYLFFLYPQYWYLVDFGSINSKEYSSLYDILDKNEYNSEYNIQTKIEKNIEYNLLAQNSYISKYDILAKKETDIGYNVLTKADYNINYDLLNTNVKEIIYDILISKEYNSKYDLLNSLPSTILYDILTSSEKSINYDILNTIRREILYDILAANYYNVGYDILKSTTKNILYDILLKSEYNVIYDILGSNVTCNIIYDILTSNESNVVYDILAKNESQVRYNILTKSKYSAVYDILNSKQYGSIYNILNKNEVNIIYDILGTLSTEYTIVYDILKSRENIIRYDILDSVEKTVDYNILNNIDYECLYDILKTNSYDILYDVLISKLYEVLYDVSSNVVIIKPKVTLKRKSFINTLIKNTSKIRQQIVFKSKINKC